VGFTGASVAATGTDVGAAGCGAQATAIVPNTATEDTLKNSRRFIFLSIAILLHLGSVEKTQKDVVWHLTISSAQADGFLGIYRQVLALMTLYSSWS
jgi:hypothetical protein